MLNDTAVLDFCLPTNGNVVFQNNACDLKIAPGVQMTYRSTTIYRASVTNRNQITLRWEWIATSWPKAAVFPDSTPVQAKECGQKWGVSQELQDGMSSHFTDLLEQLQNLPSLIVQ